MTTPAAIHSAIPATQLFGIGPSERGKPHTLQLPELHGGASMQGAANNGPKACQHNETRSGPTQPAAPYNRTLHNRTSSGCLGLFTSRQLEPQLHTTAAPLVPTHHTPSCMHHASTHTDTDQATGRCGKDCMQQISLYSLCRPAQALHTQPCNKDIAHASTPCVPQVRIQWLTPSALPTY
jgi:hypothetical protein